MAFSFDVITTSFSCKYTEKTYNSLLYMKGFNMKLRNNLLAQLIFRSVLLIIAIISLITSFTIRNIASDGGAISPFLFYTHWSCFLAELTIGASFLSTLLQFIKGKREGNNTYLPLLKFCSNIMIIATFIVAAFVLPNKIWMAGYWNFSSIFHHFLMPILVVLDSALFDRKRTYRLSYPFLGVILPLIYWIVVITRFTIKRNSCGGNIPTDLWDYYYPYGFTNMDKTSSYGFLIGLLAGILVGLIAIGFAYWALDKLEKGEDGKIHFNKNIDKENVHDVFALISRKKGA